MTVTAARFIASATEPGQYPRDDRPEIAFAGRSNVGKSSLINALVHRKGLVHTSSTPGQTRTINFFLVNERLMMVDLPGYGYAKLSRTELETWGPMMETYLTARPSLRGVVLVLDLRRKPSPEDLQMIEWLRAYGIPFLVAVTKCDKLAKGSRAPLLTAIATEAGISRNEVCPVSSLSGEGIVDLGKRIELLAFPD